MRFALERKMRGGVTSPRLRRTSSSMNETSQPYLLRAFPPKGYIIARRVSDMKFLVARFKQLMSLQVSTHPKDTLLQLTKIEMAPSSKLYIQCPELGRSRRPQPARWRRTPLTTVMSAPMLA